MVTKTNNRMIDGATVNIHDLGARPGDEIAAIFKTAIENNINVTIPEGTYYLDFVSNPVISKVGVCLLTGVGEVVFKVRHTSAVPAITLGGGFSTRSSYIKNCYFESYEDAAYSRTNYEWDAVNSSDGTSYGHTYDSGNRETLIQIGRPDAGIVGYGFVDGGITGCSGQALVLGSGSNYRATGNKIRNNRQNIVFKNTVNDYKLTVGVIRDNFLDRSAIPLSNLDMDLTTVVGSLSSAKFTSNAFDDCNYPVRILKDTGNSLTNTNIVTSLNWIEDNEFDGVVEINEFGGTTGDVFIDGQIIFSTNSADSFVYELNSRNLKLLGAEGGREVFRVGKNGASNIHFEDGSAAAPVTKFWNARGTGQFLADTEDFGIAVGGTEAARFRLSGAFNTQLYCGSNRQNMDLVGRTNVAMISDDGATAYKVELHRADEGVRFSPDNTLSNGTAAFRSSVTYSATGTINTSDEREKTDWSPLDEAEKAAALEMKASIKKYKWIEAKNTKGESARWHIGAGAQTVGNIMRKHGLDPDAYGLFCYDEWKASEGQEAGNRFALRYEEFTMFILAAI